MNIFIVTCHYKENLSWLINQNKYDYIVYSKNPDAKKILNLDNNHLKIMENRGLEATSYLKFIIDYYNNLPERVAFCHGHETAWHQDTTLLNTIKRYNNEDFLTLNNPYYRNSYYDGCPMCVNDVRSLESWETIKRVSKELGVILPDKIELTMGAQFIVTKDCILSNDISLYERCYEWLNTQNIMEDFRAAMLLEQLWYVIFTKEGIEPRLINRTILSERGYQE